MTAPVCASRPVPAGTRGLAAAGRCGRLARVTVTVTCQCCGSREVGLCAAHLLAAAGDDLLCAPCAEAGHDCPLINDTRAATVAAAERRGSP